ncbi:hypothetical protein J6590_008763 [Homalodisca vitripennis]|nr:hypothetical protein J6590_008763 [Homalodisca vitripennis]
MADALELVHGASSSLINSELNSSLSDLFEDSGDEYIPPQHAEDSSEDDVPCGSKQKRKKKKKKDDGKDVGADGSEMRQETLVATEENPPEKKRRKRNYGDPAKWKKILER